MFSLWCEVVRENVIIMESIKGTFMNPYPWLQKSKAKSVFFVIWGCTWKFNNYGINKLHFYEPLSLVTKK